MQAGQGGRQGGQTEISGAGQKGNEKAGQRQIGKERGDTEDEEGDGEQKGESEDDESYDESELRPGGSGKQGDQQQFTQEREQREDKSRNSGDSDKLHGPQFWGNLTRKNRALCSSHFRRRVSLSTPNLLN